MRIYINTSCNTEEVPFNYQQKMIGLLHKWLGENELHDLISLYSFSWLTNGNIANNGFSFKNGAKWFISFHEDKYVKQVIRTILNDPKMFSGLKVADVTIQEDIDLSRIEYFKLASPILIKRKKDDNIKFYTYEDSEANGFLIETIHHKMQLAGLPMDDSLEISFDLKYTNKKIKKVQIHGIDNKCSMCPVIIKGKESTKEFIWNVGLGNSTGSGFGSIF
jgi:CRISPR-associated endoribonuclease Cas6